VHDPRVALAREATVAPVPATRRSTSADVLLFTRHLHRAGAATRWKLAAIFAKPREARHRASVRERKRRRWLRPPVCFRCKCAVRRVRKRALENCSSSFAVGHWRAPSAFNCAIAALGSSTSIATCKGVIPGPSANSANVAASRWRAPCESRRHLRRRRRTTFRKQRAGEDRANEAVLLWSGSNRPPRTTVADQLFRGHVINAHKPPFAAAVTERLISPMRRARPGRETPLAPRYRFGRGRSRACWRRSCV
jgi:hypothetical protein